MPALSPGDPGGEKSGSQIRRGHFFDYVKQKHRSRMQNLAPLAPKPMLDTWDVPGEPTPGKTLLPVGRQKGMDGENNLVQLKGVFGEDFRVSIDAGHRRAEEGHAYCLL